MNDANENREETDAGAEPNPLTTEECTAEQSTETLLTEETEETLEKESETAEQGIINLCFG